MEKKLLLIMILAVPSAVTAQFYDNDGHLEVIWSAPSSGIPLDHYIWSYEINGVADSLEGQSTAPDTLEDSVDLAEIGDWAIFSIRAVSIFADTSAAAITDTAYYNPETGMDPPRRVRWRQGP